MTIAPSSLPTVRVSASPSVAIEAEGGFVIFEFQVNGALPSQGIPIQLVSNDELIGSQFVPPLNYQAARLSGAKEFSRTLRSIGPGFAAPVFEQLTLTLTAHQSSIAIPIAPNGIDTEPISLAYRMISRPDYQLDSAQGLLQYTILETRPNLDRQPFNSIFGSDFEDALLGTASRDVIDGGMGNDTLEGLDGDDILIGGAGSDRILGGNGNDILMAGDGKNRHTGAEILQGGPGSDIYVIRPGDNYRVGELGQFSRQFEVGTDKLAVLRDEIDPRTLTYRGYGRFGRPYVIVSDFVNFSVEFSALGDGFTSGTDLGPKDVLELIIRPIGAVVLGANEGSQFLGSELNDEIYGSNGSDRILGFDGDDLLVGGAGFDRIAGGDGRDIILGGNGAFIRGGPGADVYVVRPSNTRPIFISDFNGKEDRIGFIHGEIAPNDLAFQIGNGTTVSSGVYQVSTGNLLAIISNASTLPDFTQTSALTVIVSASLSI